MIPSGDFIPLRYFLPGARDFFLIFLWKMFTNIKEKRNAYVGFFGVKKKSTFISMALTFEKDLNQICVRFFAYKRFQL